MNARIANNREVYYKLIWKYEKKRELMRKEMMEKYGYDSRNHRVPTPPEYALFSKRCSAKIRVYRLAIQRMDKHLGVIASTSKHISEFMNVSVHKRMGKRDARHSLARAMFSKYLLERGVKGYLINNWIGSNTRTYCTMARQELNMSFSSKPERRELYHRFLEFVRNQE